MKSGSGKLVLIDGKLRNSLYLNDRDVGELWNPKPFVLFELIADYELHFPSLHQCTCSHIYNNEDMQKTFGF